MYLIRYLKVPPYCCMKRRCTMRRLQMTDTQGCKVHVCGVRGGKPPSRTSIPYTSNSIAAYEDTPYKLT